MCSRGCNQVLSIKRWLYSCGQLKPAKNNEDSGPRWFTVAIMWLSHVALVLLSFVVLYVLNTSTFHHHTHNTLQVQIWEVISIKNITANCIIVDVSFFFFFSMYAFVCSKPDIRCVTWLASISHVLQEIGVVRMTYGQKNEHGWDKGLMCP